jgi:hypothetical protein
MSHNITVSRVWFDIVHRGEDRSPADRFGAHFVVGYSSQDQVEAWGLPVTCSSCSECRNAARPRDDRWKYSSSRIGRRRVARRKHRWQPRGPRLKLTDRSQTCCCDGDVCMGKRCQCPGCLRYVSACFFVDDALPQVCDNCWGSLKDSLRNQLDKATADLQSERQMRELAEKFHDVLVAEKRLLLHQHERALRAYARLWALADQLVRERRAPSADEAECISCDQPEGVWDELRSMNIAPERTST